MQGIPEVNFIPKFPHLKQKLGEEELNVEKVQNDVEKKEKKVEKKKEKKGEKLDEYEFFDPEELDIEFPFIAVYSSRRSGKSVAVKSLVHKMQKKFTDIYLFSKTAKLQELYDYIPERNQFVGIDREKINKIRDDQMQQKLNGGFKKRPLLVFDDVISENLRYVQEFVDVAICLRHWGISAIAISQTITGFPPAVRNNADIACSFFLDNQRERELFVESYLSRIDKKEGMKVFSRITEEPYSMIVIPRFMPAVRQYKDYVKWYRADMKEKMKFKFSAHVVVEDPLTNAGIAESDVSLRVRRNPYEKLY